MTIPVLIEPVGEGGYRASGGPPFVMSAQGATPDEALGRLRDEIQAKIAAGAILVPLEVGPPQHDPWRRVEGIFKDEPLFDAWLEAIEENRRRDDEETGALEEQ